MNLFNDAIVAPPLPVIWTNTHSGRRRVDPNQLSFDDFLPSVAHGAPQAKAPTPPSEEGLVRSRNYRITGCESIGEGSLKQKYKNNVEAIRLLKLIESEEREATSEEKSALVKYSGWGGIPQVFDSFNSDWEKEYEELEELLTEDEYDSAKASTPNGHYTPPLIIRFIYDVLSRMGFRGGRILEPSMGVGHFFGMLPQGISSGSRLCGVELDPLSGRISKLLYPEADIRIAGFEDAKFPDNFFDLAISNVPFGNYRVHDPRYDRYRFSIHDYFFAKAVDVARPGGMVTFITSMFTLDKKESRLRKYLFERADLIGAVRLPNTAFKGIANTSVTSDVIFLRKRQGGVLPGSCSWIESRPHPVKGGAEEEINEYFIDNPGMMLGKLGVSKKMYGRHEVTLNPDGRPLEEALKEALRHFPEALLKDGFLWRPHTHEEFLPAPESLKEGAFTIVSGRLYANSEGTLTPYETSAGRAKRIEGLIGIRDAAKALLCDEMTSNEESSVELRRLHLNSLYDRFVLNHGCVNSRENRSAFSEDPDYPLVLSLEIYDEDTQKAQKADIFSKRVIHPEKRVERTETSHEALLVSLNETGKVDFARMKELTGTEVPELQRELEGLIFLNPEGDWEPADEYLSGNVRRKLDAAERASLIDGQFAKNVEALRAVQPKLLDFSEISVNLGASWMPAEDIRDFIEGLLKIKECVKVSYSPVIGTWTVDVEESKKWIVLDSVKNTNRWGTSRCNALQLIKDALNHRIPTVKDEVDERYIVNVTETEAAREKQFLIKERFREWVWEDTGRRERLTQLYNEMFNNLRPRIFNGDHLTLPGISSQVTLRPHQKDAVWRIIQTGNTLLAHVVGSGKTFCKTAAAMEMKRLGLVAKPMLIVPNHLLEQWSAEFLRLYPLANVLIAGRDDFTPLKRKKLMAKIAANNWDAVIVTHSSFEKLPMSKESVTKFIQRQIEELEDAIMGARDEDRDSGIIKELEKAKKRLEVKIRERLNERAKDDGLSFEELGIDMLLVDEADLFKNLYFVTKMTRVAGLPNSESNRAFDLYIKTQWMFGRKYPVVFGTGTPVSNTMAELYTMQRYLQPDALRDYGIQHFDSWAATFGEVVTSLEIAPDGSGYRLRSRFARFNNLPELLQIWRLVADVQTDDMVDIDKPDIEGGKAETVVAPASEEQKRYVDELVARAEAIRRGHVKPSEDNMLKLTSDGRKAALDIRLIFPSLPDYPDSKTNLAAQRIYDRWKEASSFRGTQLVFCDLSTPKSIEFNVYTDIKKKLVGMGIPESEITFIHEANTDIKKKVLFFRVNSGSVRILMGSTEKMGAGMNVQKRLKALHHIDAPWRPRDIEQREGRILRQGNENETIAIYRYVTEGTFDAYMWQVLESKARFIAQIMTGKLAARSADDIEGVVLTYAEVKALASGNPLVMEKFKVDTEVKRLQSLYAQHKREGYRMESEISYLLSSVPSIKETIDSLDHDLSIRALPAEFSMTINGRVFVERKEAGNEILRHALYLKGRNAYEEIGTYAGFTIFLKSRAEAFHQQRLIARGKAEHIGSISESEVGTIASLEYALKGIEKRLAERRVALSESEKRLEGLRTEIAKPFQYEEKMRELLHRQYEIEKQLDLDKRESTGGIGDEEVMEAA